MCCFSQSVIQVSNTRIFARALDSVNQALHPARTRWRRHEQVQFDHRLYMQHDDAVQTPGWESGLAAAVCVENERAKGLVSMTQCVRSLSLYGMRKNEDVLVRIDGGDSGRRAA